MDLITRSKVQLERDEGRRPRIYTDSLGNRSIGIGINLEIALTDEEIDWLFQNRWVRIAKELVQQLPWIVYLDDARLGAVMNMAFNLGVPGLLRFQLMLAALQKKQWAEASNQARMSTWFTQVGQRGPRVVNQLLTGVWQ